MIPKKKPIRPHLVRFHCNCWWCNSLLDNLPPEETQEVWRVRFDKYHEVVFCDINCLMAWNLSDAAPQTDAVATDATNHSVRIKGGSGHPGYQKRRVGSSPTPKKEGQDTQGTLWFTLVDVENMKPWHVLYKDLKRILKTQGHWKDLPKGGSFKQGNPYRFTSQDKN